MLRLVTTKRVSGPSAPASTWAIIRSTRLLLLAPSKNPMKRRILPLVGAPLKLAFNAVHGGQQLRPFNAHYDEYGFQPILVFDGEGRFITAVLRPAKRPSGKEIKPFLRRLLRAIRAHWPNTEILLRADSHYCGPEVLDWCRAGGLDYILGVAPTTTLRRHLEGLEVRVKAPVLPFVDRLQNRVPGFRSEAQRA